MLMNFAHRCRRHFVMLPSRELARDRRASERNVVIRGERESDRYSDRYRYKPTFLTGSQSPKFGLPDRRVSPSVQTASVGGDSCHHANYIAHSHMVVNCLHQTRQDLNNARLVVNRAVADICKDVHGVYTWRQRCFRLHTERFFRNECVHLNFIGIRKYVNEVRKTSLFDARRIVP